MRLTSKKRNLNWKLLQQAIREYVRIHGKRPLVSNTRAKWTSWLNYTLPK